VDKQADKIDEPVNEAAQAPDWRICPRGDSHAWVSEHRPGHAVYWIRQCALCHQVDLDDLDRAIAERIRAMTAKPHDMEQISAQPLEFPITDESIFRMAGELKVVRGKNGITRLYIDGAYFPFATLDGFHIAISRRAMPGVTLTIVADTVKVDDTWLASSNEDETPTK
jgi:hypothetical protein